MIPTGGTGDSISVWFACKICRHVFQNVEHFLKHKIEVHFDELQKLNYIVFEEISISDNTLRYNVPDASLLATAAIKQENQNLSSDAQHLDLEPLIDNELETEDDADDSICPVQNEPRNVQKNPYVLLQRLTSKEIQQYDKCQTQVILPQHLKGVPSELEARPFKCLRTKREKALKTRTTSVMHLKSHTHYRIFKCSIANCIKAFKTRKSLLTHLESHTEEKIFKCQEPRCEKAFSIRDNYESHLETHTRKKIFKCPRSNCKESYIIRSQLRKHVLTHSKKKQFKCQEPDCGVTLKSQEYLRGHLKIHSDSRPCFHCPYPNCGKAFRYNVSLNVHFAKHHSQELSASGEILMEYKNCGRSDCPAIHCNKVRPAKSPIKCTQPNCAKEFKYESQLRQHLLSHSSVQQYKCSVPNCGKTYKNRFHLNAHVKAKGRNSHNPHFIFFNRAGKN